MPLYQMKIVIQANKTDEFVESLRSLVSDFNKEKGCIGCSLYRDFEKENTFCMVGEWETRQDMENHFQSRNFEVLLGAASVLGNTFKMIITEVLETGGYELAKSKFASTENQRAL